MRTPRPHPAGQRDAAVQRLAQLTAGLDPGPVASGDDPSPTGDAPTPWWAGHTVPRSAAGTDVVTEVEEPPDRDTAARPAREPGRHAARRLPAPGLRERVRVPDPVARHAWWLAPPQVAVLAVVVAVGLVLTTWWVLRGHPSDVAAPATVDSAPALTELTADTTAAAQVLPGGVDSTGAPPGDGSVTVDVTGRVRHPGIAVLDAGSRVADALDAAGGARPGTDLDGLNLARVLVDGEQIVVGGQAGPPPAGLPSSSVPSGALPTDPSGAPVALVNINTAGESELDTLPEVGPVTAAAIIAWRTENGGFSTVAELLEVDGIGDATLAKLTPYVTV